MSLFKREQTLVAVQARVDIDRAIRESIDVKPAEF